VAFIPVPRWLPTANNRKSSRAIRSLRVRAEEIARGLAAERHRPGSLLRNLIEGVAHERDPRVSARNEILTFLLAGYETTSATLTWSLYLLARNPEVLTDVQREVAVLNGAPAGIDDLPRLPLLRMVIDETMRLFPPVWMLPRRALAEDRIGGYRIPRGTDVLISLYSLHRHPAFWQDPNRFDPYRFAPGARISQGSYLPFGAGPRTCIGSGLGMLEAVAFLSAVTARYEFRLEQSAEPECEASLSLHPRHGLPIRVRRRPPEWVQIRGPAQTANTEKPSNRRSSYHCPWLNVEPWQERTRDQT